MTTGQVPITTAYEGTTSRHKPTFPYATMVKLKPIGKAPPGVEAMRRLFLITLAACSLILWTRESSAQVAIDFERYPNGSVVADTVVLSNQFLPWGVLLTHDLVGRGLGALVVAEGDRGVFNFGNSHTKAVAIGDYGGSTTISFVDPVSGQPRPVSRVWMLLGDGDPASETFTIEARNLVGALINQDGPVTTTANGHVYSFNAGSPVIASVKTILASNSASGAVFDDLWIDREPCPAITSPPTSSAACPTEVAEFVVTASGAGLLGYQWQLETSPNNWINANNGGLPYNGGTIMASGVTISQLQLSLNTLPGAPAIRFRCIVSNACGSVTSDPATLTICAADFNCSGDISVQDIFDFLAAYFGNDPRADFNASGAISVQDIFDFLAAYFAGCS